MEDQAENTDKKFNEVKDRLDQKIIDLKAELSLS